MSSYQYGTGLAIYRTGAGILEGLQIAKDREITRETARLQQRAAELELEQKEDELRLRQNNETISSLVAMDIISSQNPRELSPNISNLMEGYLSSWLVVLFLRKTHVNLI